MAQTGYTPILLYYSATPGAQPSSGNLVNGELALNTADGILYYKNSGGTVTPFSSGGLSWQATQTGNFTASANNIYPINTTSGAVTVTLPASPTVGQSVGFVDYAGTFATNNVTVNPNGNKLQGSTYNVLLTNVREAITFVYVDSTEGWLPYSSYNGVITPLSISYLIVAGGGAGGGPQGGGGGGGGVISGTTPITPGTTYSFVVGSGGTGVSTTSGTNGTNSTAFGLTAVGGGGGSASSTTPGNGGSGGGASTGYTTPGTGTSGQGYAGGTANISYESGAGGGGAGAVGGNAGAAGGNGGNGVLSSITGTPTYYGGGGGGGIFLPFGSTPGTGGLGGGGNGNVGSNANGFNGTNGLGGGGGGGGDNSSAYLAAGGNGGSGVVIISVPTSIYTGTYTGSPTITTVGGNTVLQFLANGSYTA